MGRVRGRGYHCKGRGYGGVRGCCCFLRRWLFPFVAKTSLLKQQHAVSNSSK